MSRDESRPTVVLQYLSLPADLEEGQYDAEGRRVEGDPERVRLVLHRLPGEPNPWQCWGVVDPPLEPGQTAQVVFFNVAGSAVPGGAFTEWDRRTAEPYFTRALLTVRSVSRGVGRARIVGRNDSARRVSAAAGLLFVAPLETAGEESGASAPAPARGEGAADRPVRKRRKKTRAKKAPPVEPTAADGEEE